MLTGRRRRQWGSGCWARWINRNPVELKMADSGAQQRKHLPLPLSLSLSPSLPLHLSLCMWQNSTIYLFQKSVSGNHLIFIASFDSNDFMKPLILARSPWLQHRRVPLLISDSISSEQCTAVAPDTYMPPTLKCAGNLFSPRCSSSWCNSHSDKNPSLWYLATKWEDGQREGSLVVGGGFGWSHIFVITIRRERMVTRQVSNIQN